MLFCLFLAAYLSFFKLRLYLEDALHTSKIPKFWCSGQKCPTFGENLEINCLGQKCPISRKFPKVGCLDQKSPIKGENPQIWVLMSKMPDVVRKSQNWDVYFKNAIFWGKFKYGSVQFEYNYLGHIL